MKNRNHLLYPAANASTVRPKLLACVFLVAALLGAPSQAVAAAAGALVPPDLKAKHTAAAAKALLKLPLRFEATADGKAMAVHLGNQELLLGNAGTLKLEGGTGSALSIELEGANRDSFPVGQDRLPGKSNYFIGNDPSTWRKGVEQFSKARVRNVYNGVDLLYYGNGSEFEHDYILAPGSDPSAIRMRITGGSTGIDSKSGDLIVSSPGPAVEMMRLRHPVAYQLRSDGSRATVAVGYREEEDGSFQFSLGSYDRQRPLVIDPVILYGTYFGGSGDDSIVDLKLGPDGGIYFLMTTGSGNLKTMGNPPNACPGGCEGGPRYYVAELDKTGATLVFATYIGGSSDNEAYNLALDTDGSIYIAGITGSADFPLANAYPGGQPLDKGAATADSTLTKLSADGSQLLYSTYIGLGLPGPTFTYGTVPQYMVAAGNGIVYMLGAATTGNDPDVSFIYKKNPLFTVGLDFVAKVDTTKTGTDAILYATQIGDANSSGSATLSSLALDSQGDLWVYGLTSNAAFPAASPDAVQAACSVSSAGACNSGFLMELNSAGGAVLYATFLGGTGALSPYEIKLDASDNIYLLGKTSQADYPTKSGVYTTLPAANSGYLSKLAPDGKTLLYSTYLYAGIEAIEVSANGQAAFAGSSESGFPTKNSLAATAPKYAYDAVFGLIDTTLSGDASLLISSYLGAAGTTGAGSIEFSSGGQFLIAGRTTAMDLPVVKPYQATCPSCNSTQGDGFIVAIQPSNTLTLTPTTLPFPSTMVGTISAKMTASLYNGTTQSIYLKQPTLSDSTDFTQSDDCNGILSPNTGCTISFTFTPKSSGTLTSTYTTGDLDDPSNLLTISLTGTGTGSSATLSISTTALSFPATAVGSTSSAMTATLSNLTSATLNLTSPTLSNATDFSISANTCAATATIAPNGTCTFSFTFNPASTGAKTATFSIADINNTAPPLTIALSGDSISQPTLKFLPIALAFGPVADGTSAVQSTTVTNGGIGPVPITGASVTGTGFSLTNNGCGSSVPANGSCQYGVTVSPTTIGPLTGTLTVTDSLGTQTVPLTATGTQRSTTNTVTPSSINFGNVTVGTYSATNVVTFTNNASSPVTIASYSVNGMFSAVGNGNCIAAATVVNAMGTCTYNIYLRPQTVGSYSGTFTVLDGITNPSVALTATAIAAGSSPQVVLTPNPLTFANAPQGQGTVQTITLTNASAATILVEEDENTADAPFQVSTVATDQTVCPDDAYSINGVNRFQVSIPPGGFCSYQVTFPGNIAPDTTATGTITLHYAYPGTLPDYQVPLSAFTYVATASVTANELTAADAVVTPTAIQFPATASGTTSPAQTVTVTNTGEEPLGFTSAILSGTNAANFKANPNCPASLAKNNTCQITVTFSPDESTNEFTAVLDVKTSTGDTNVTLNGGTNPSDFVLSTSTPGTQGPTNPTWVIDVTPLTASIGFYEPITFTSDLDKSFGTIVFTPNSVTPGAKAVSTTATLTPPSSSARLERPLVNLRKGWPILACFVFLFSFGRKFRSVRGRKILLLIACIFLGIMTARAKSSSPPTVTFTVTATSGSVSHTVELTYQPPS